MVTKKRYTMDVGFKFKPLVYRQPGLAEISIGAGIAMCFVRGVSAAMSAEYHAELVYR